MANSKNNTDDSTTTTAAAPNPNFVVVSNSMGVSPSRTIAPTKKARVSVDDDDGGVTGTSTETPYRYEMLAAGGKYRVYADDMTALCEYLIPSYSALHDKEETSVEKMAARIIYAVGCQVQLQAFLLVESEARGEGPTPQELAVLEAPRDVPPQLEMWESEVPLVLVSTYYEPIGTLPRPEGIPLGMGEPGANLVWLDPMLEFDLLISLHEAGWISLFERNLPATSPVVSAGPAGTGTAAKTE